MVYIEELCLSGACHRGIMYVGSFKYLEEIGLLKKSKLKRVIGTSIGSFVLACYISGYTINELVSMILDIDFKIFKDWVSEITVNLFNGLTFKAWVKKCLSKYLPNDITISDFYKKTGIDFTIVMVSLENGLIYASYKNKPNMTLLSAVLASMNFPFVFPPFETSDGLSKDIYVDGGLLDNFAIHLLGPRAIGLTSVKKQRTLTDITSPFSYFIKMTELVGSLVRDLRRPHSEYIIEIYSNDSEIVDFDLNRDDKITLYKLGYNSTKNSHIIDKFICDFYINLFNKVLEELTIVSLFYKFNKISTNLQQYVQQYEKKVENM